jgi:hypothetical protein
MPVLDATPDTQDTPDLPDPFEVQRQTSRQLAKPTVEGYTIVAFIGEGTYGDVWKAVHKESGTVDAIKRLHKRPDAQARGEARMLAALSAARGIVRLKKTQLEAEPYCHVMEFMQGGTLGELIERSGKLPFAKAWDMFRELVEGLRYVHREGAVHCDIKPDNILLDALGKPRLSDFGQARGHGPGGASLGTPFYMPPEQARLGLPDPRWDVYALGAVLYQMLTGTKPRHNHELANEMSLHSQSSTEVNTRLQKYAAHLDRVPGIGELKNIDPGVVDLLKRCLANDFEARPKDACEVYSLVAKLERKRRQRSLLFFGGIGPAAALLAVGFLMLVGGWFALDAFQTMWIDQVVDDNQAVASAIAEATKERFNDQMGIVESESAKWHELFANRTEDEAGFGERVAARIRETFKLHQQKLHGWHVTLPDGKMVANFGDVPQQGKATFDTTVVNKQYGWRGWFNGEIDLGSDAERKAFSGEKALEVLKKRKRDLFVSAPYMRRQKDFWVMTISRKLSSDGKPLGVLAGQFRFDGSKGFISFIRNFEKSGGYQRKVVIANEQGEALYHPELRDSISDFREDDESSAGDGENVPVVGSDNELVRAAFGGDTKSDLLEHADPWYPAPGNEYFVGRVAVELGNENANSDQKLAVFVFHDKDHALRGFNRAWWTAMLLGLGILLLGGLFLIANIWGLRRTLSREEAVEYA